MEIQNETMIPGPASFPVRELSFWVGFVHGRGSFPKPGPRGCSHHPGSFYKAEEDAAMGHMGFSP